jgi:electron transfer flavoprotein alpha subunit|nr:MAG: electron transfer flavoprotein subunit alpha [Bacteroidota bacterium]
MSVIAYAEQRDGQLRKPAFEVVRKGAELARELGLPFYAVLIGSGVKGLAERLGAYGAERVIVVDQPELAAFAPAAYGRALALAAESRNARLVLLPATAQGKDLAPRVAVRLDAAFAPDVTALRVEDGLLQAVRPVYSGKAFATLIFRKERQVISLRPNVFPAGTPQDGISPQVEVLTVSVEEADLRAQAREIVASAGKLDVAEADIVVSGGRGLKGPENFWMIEELAALLGGAVGASRAVVDAGWRPHAEQVGQTGKVVTPKLYIAVAISGAIQHLAGMSGSRVIVAINKDPEAPIFQVADYGIVGDAFEVVPQLIEAIKKFKQA